MSDLNHKVHALLLEQIERGTQLGTQVCAYRHGERIVDTWAGSMGPNDPRPVQADSLFSSFSTTKGVAATALHILADRGIIDYEEPVASYWPAFGQNGKGRITVAQAMSHQAGLHALPVPYTLEFVTDWEAGIRWIEEGAPAWEPGTATGYHALTYAWVVGGIVQHATAGRHIKDVIQEEIAAPLGVEGEMFVGIPDGLDERLTTLKQAPPNPDSPMARLPKDHDLFKAMPPGAPFTFDDMAIRKACLPSANGHFTARALAGMYGALANGGELDGVRLVSPDRIAAMSRCVVATPDRVILMPLRKGIGFFLGGAVNGAHGAMGPRESAFGHPGAGGSIAFADPDVGLSVAVTINHMQTTLQAEGPTYEVCELIRNELGLEA